MSDAITILRTLTAEQIRARLAELDGEQRQLRVLLRSVVSRDRAKGRHLKRSDTRSDGESPPLVASKELTESESAAQGPVSAKAHRIIPATKKGVST